MATRTANNSKEAVVLKGSPRAKAQGAFFLVSLTANQGAVFVSASPQLSHPPMATSFPSALASILKTSPSSHYLFLQVAILAPSNFCLKALMASRTYNGRFEYVPLGTAEPQAYKGPSKGL